jgi:protein SCO1/2
MNSKSLRRAMYAIAIMASLGLGAVLGAQQFSHASPLDTAQLLTAPKMMPEIALENQQGEAVAADSFDGHWSLVFFGFTSCPDFCPLELQKLGKVLNLMEAEEELRVVFVSVDPERDGREKLADYVNFFHPYIIGLRGSNLELAKFAQFFGAAYDRSAIVDNRVLSIPAGINMPHGIGDQYQVNHSSRVFIVNPAGDFIGSFAPPYTTEEILSDMQNLMKN